MAKRNRPSQYKRRKTKHGKPSKHTLRFRESITFTRPVRSLASVGGPTRRAMKKRINRHQMALPKDVGLPARILAGIASFAQHARELLNRPDLQSRSAIRRAQQKSTS